MKIAIYHNIPSGGAKRALYEQVVRLAKHHQVDLYYLSTNDEHFLDLRPHVHQSFRYPFFALHRRRIWQALEWISYAIEVVVFQRTARRIARDIEQRQYAIVYIHQCEFSHIPVLTRLIRTTPTVIYCQEPWRAIYEPRMLFSSTASPRPVLPVHEAILRLLWLCQWPWIQFMKRHDRQNIAAARTVLANSRYSQTYIAQAYGVSPVVQYLGLDETLFTPANGGTHPAYLLSAGGIAPAKGFDQSILALAQVDQHIRPKLIIAADRTSGSVLQTYLERLAQENRVQVEFRSQITDQQLVQLYQQATALLYTPVREPFGLVAIEAMACGTPVIGVREGGLLETIQDGVNGLLVERSAKHLAEAITRLLATSSMREGLAAACRASVVPKFTWTTSVQHLETIFKAIAHDHRH